MIHLINFIYTITILCYVIYIKNNQDNIIFKLEHIQNEIKLINYNLTISLD